ncbi:hypothetical protein QBC43DRAFT_354769 [Cladorrhinum sp. PSN259]|nr:hypothetical protein QBC43DRAFT_354769 [Cladorrhinum sp. PSN259]
MIAQHIDTLNSIAGLYLSPQQHALIFKTGTRGEPLVRRMGSLRNGCPACTLSVIAGDPNHLINLQASCLARSRGSSSSSSSNTRVPRLLRIIKGWISQFDPGEEAWKMCVESGRLAERLVEVRRRMRKMRKERVGERQSSRREEQKTHNEKANVENYEGGIHKRTEMRKVEEDGRAKEGKMMGASKKILAKGRRRRDWLGYGEMMDLDRGLLGQDDDEQEEGDEDEQDVDDEEEKDNYDGADYIPPRKHWKHHRPNTLASEILLDRPRPEEYDDLILGIRRPSSVYSLDTAWSEFI